MGHNLCFAPNTDGTEWNAGTGSFAEWQASSGLDANTLVADPEFASVVGPDFDLAPDSASSPLVNNGHPSESSGTELIGTSRDAAPNIGADEH